MRGRWNEARRKEKKKKKRVRERKKNGIDSRRPKMTTTNKEVR